MFSFKDWLRTQIEEELQRAIYYEAAGNTWVQEDCFEEALHYENTLNELLSRCR